MSSTAVGDAGQRVSAEGRAATVSRVECLWESLQFARFASFVGDQNKSLSQGSMFPEMNFFIKKIKIKSKAPTL